MRKISRLQILRRISQVSAMVFFTGTFALAFNGFQVLYTSLINQEFGLAKLGMFLVPLGIVIILSLIFGRIFCGWFCAFGAFTDLIHQLFKKLFKINFQVNPLLDSILKYAKYLILALIIGLVWTLNRIPAELFTPWTAFAQLGELFSGYFVLSFSFLTLILAIVGAVFIERFYCRYLCPLGAILALLSKISAVKLTKPDIQCHLCKRCGATCPMGINLNNAATVADGECIRCLECVTACPRQNLRVSLPTGSLNTVAYAITAIIVFPLINLAEPLLLTKVNPIAPTKSAAVSAAQTTPSPETGQPDRFTPDSSSSKQLLPADNEKVNSSSTDSSVEIREENGQNEITTAVKTITGDKQYKDGIYQGSATGFRPGLVVTVTVKNNQITDIKILESHDDSRFLNLAIQNVPPEIIATQSPEVDAVSGATFSSRGIMEAVKDALAKAI